MLPELHDPHLRALEKAALGPELADAEVVEIDRDQAAEQEPAAPRGGPGLEIGDAGPPQSLGAVIRNTGRSSALMPASEVARSQTRSAGDAGHC